MKTTNLILIFLLLLSVGCSDSDGDKIEEKAKEEVQEIVSVLANEEETSIFSQHLSSVDLEGVDVDEFTVLVPKNSVFSHPQADMLPHTSGFEVKRHIIKGSFSKDQLEELTSVIALNNETLEVRTDIDNNVYINDILLGKYKRVGKSTIFYVEDFIPESYAIQGKYTIHLSVMLMEPGRPEQPLEGVEIGIYRLPDTTLFASLVTDQYGVTREDILEGKPEDYLYKINSKKYSNHYKGWQFNGIFESWEEIKYHPVDYRKTGLVKVPGGIKLEDLNYDEIIDEKDKIGSGYFPLKDVGRVWVIHSNYKVPETALPEFLVNECSYYTWLEVKDFDKEYAELSKRMQIRPDDEKLWEIWYNFYDRIFLANDLLSYPTPDHIEQTKLKAQVRRHRAHLYLGLTTYFGNVPLILDNSDIGKAASTRAEIYAAIEKDLDWLLENTKMDETSYWHTWGHTVIDKGWLALQRKDYTKATQILNTILPKFDYWNPFGGNSGFCYTRLFLAEAAWKSGNNSRAVELLNEIYVKLKKDPLTSNSDATISDVLKGFYAQWQTGSDNWYSWTYQNIERWEINKEWSTKYKLLPIPAKALEENTKLKQNTGW